MSGIIGSIEHFSGNAEEFEIYCERVDHLFKVNVVSEDMKLSMFITFAGPVVYTTLKNLVAPNSPGSMKFEEVIATLKKHYTPVKSEISERFTFNKCNQKPGQTVSDYIVELRRLANACNFGAFLDEALRDRLVCGLAAETLQKKLLSESELTFTKACNMAQAHEMADKQVKLLVGSTGNGQIHGIKPKASMSQKSQNQSSGKRRENPEQSQKSSQMKCYRCGRQHSPATCPAKSWECFCCKKKGHTSKVCRNRNQNKVGAMQEVAAESVDHIASDLYPLHNISENDLHNVPHQLELSIGEEMVSFEVDTGACKTVVPVKWFKGKFPNIVLRDVSFSLTSVTGQSIKAVGEAIIDVYRGSRKYSLPLTVVESQRHFTPLLGRNWLNTLFPSWRENFKVASLSVSNLVSELKHKFQTVFNSDLSKPIKEFEISFKLKEGADPIFKKAYTMPYALKPKVENKLKLLVESGIIKPVTNSQWASPIVVVPKKAGDVRICVDFRGTVNQVLVPEQYPLPTMEDIFATLSGKQVFTVLDLTGAYSQLKVNEKCQEMLTINTHVGLFRYTRLSYGISCAPSLFQSIMDRILAGIPNVSCYLDDILIAGSDIEECRKLVHEVLSRLEHYEVKVNLSKCRFYEGSVEYLGHRIDKDGIHPTTEKLRAIQDAPEPQNVTQLRAYLGLLNYYSKFIPMLSSQIRPLYSLLEKNVDFVWSKECQSSFELSKKLIMQNQVLTHYDPNKTLVVSCDASSYGVGSVLSIRENGVDKPVFFASGTLSKAEKNYSQIEREALALIFGIKRFHKYIYGRPFILVTDHQPLKTIFNPEKGISVMSASRLVRWNVILSAYNYIIEYKKGSDMYEADALSRLPLKDSTNVEFAINSFNMLDELPLSNVEVAKASAKDPVLLKVKDFCLRGWPSKIVDPILKPYFIKRTELSVEGDYVLKGNKVIIPEILRSKVLEIIHSDHIGMVRCKLLARTTVWWPGINTDIEMLVSKCRVCQYSQNNAQETNLISWPKTENVWQRVHIDFFYFKGNVFLLIVDSHTKWLDIHLMSRGTDINSTVEKLKETFSVMGIPELLVSDNGPPFNSAEFQKFCQLNGIIPLKSPPYHPQSNGLAERHVRNVKTALKKYLVEGSNLTVKQQVTNFLFSYRNTPSSNTGLSPNNAVFKFKPRTKLDMLKPKNGGSIIVQKPENYTKQAYFVVGEKVLVGNLGPSSHVKWKEGVVMKIISGLTYLVKVEDKILYKHVNHIRKCMLNETVDINIPVQPVITTHVSPSNTSVQETPSYSPKTSIVDKSNLEKSGYVGPIPVATQTNSPKASSNASQVHVSKTPVGIELTEPVRRSARIVKPPTRLNL